MFEKFPQIACYAPAELEEIVLFRITPEIISFSITAKGSDILISLRLPSKIHRPPVFSVALTIQLKRCASSGVATRSLTIGSCRGRSESARIRCQWYTRPGSRSVSWTNKWTRSVLRVRTSAKGVPSSPGSPAWR